MKPNTERAVMEFYLSPKVTEEMLEKKMEADEIILMEEEAYYFLIYVVDHNMVGEYREDMESQMGYSMEYMCQCLPVGMNTEMGVILLFTPEEQDLFLEESELKETLSHAILQLQYLPISANPEMGMDEEISEEQDAFTINAIRGFDSYQDEESLEELSLETPQEEESESNSDDYWI